VAYHPVPVSNRLKGLTQHLHLHKGANQAMLPQLLLRQTSRGRMRPSQMGSSRGPNPRSAASPPPDDSDAANTHPASMWTPRVKACVADAAVASLIVFTGVFINSYMMEHE